MVPSGVCLNGNTFKIVSGVVNWGDDVTLKLQPSSMHHRQCQSVQQRNARGTMVPTLTDANTQATLFPSSLFVTTVFLSCDVGGLTGFHYHYSCTAPLLSTTSQSSNMTNSSVALLCFIMIACSSSAFQTGNRGRPQTVTVSSSKLPHVSHSSSRLYSTPMKDLPTAAADTESNVSTTDFIFSEISSHNVRMCT